MSSKIPSDSQLELLDELLPNQKRKKVTEIHTLTLASVIRAGYVRRVRGRVEATPLGRRTARFYKKRFFNSWGSDIGFARALKAQYSK